jgi:transcriptional regulator with XRE-family HTH domain
MEAFLQNLAANVCTLRKSRGLTQDQLAKISKIPRTTLAYVESGEGNPSLKLVIQIAQALRVRTEELLASPRPPCLLIKADDLEATYRLKKMVKIEKLLPDPVPGLQFERLKLEPKMTLIGIPHSAGTKEYFTCTKGCIEVRVGSEIFPLHEGDVVSFPGSWRHSYRNMVDQKSQGISIVCYPLGG